MKCDPTRVCERLVGLGDVEVLGIDDETAGPLRVRIRRRAPRPDCEVCGGPLWPNGEREVELVDLPAFGRPARLVQQAPVALPTAGCPAGAVTEQAPEIAPPREKLTARAGRWATRQAGRARSLPSLLHGQSSSVPLRIANEKRTRQGVSPTVALGVSGGLMVDARAGHMGRTRANLLLAANSSRPMCADDDETLRSVNYLFV